MTNETVVEGRKFRQIIDPIVRNWIRTDPIWISEKYKMNSLRKFDPITKGETNSHKSFFNYHRIL